MPVSAKQQAANVRNAQKSTGPRSPEGKARSRRNAMKHGLTGSGTCLIDIARHEVEAEIPAFTAVYEPRDAVERRYVEQAALASVRHNRGNAKSEAATL